jgi:hypothetical protein
MLIAKREMSKNRRAGLVEQTQPVFPEASAIDANNSSIIINCRHIRGSLKCDTSESQFSLFFFFFLLSAFPINIQPKSNLISSPTITTQWQIDLVLGLKWLKRAL